MQGLFAARIALESTLYIFCGLWPYSITTRIKTSRRIIISHLLNAQCLCPYTSEGGWRKSGYGNLAQRIFSAGIMVSLYVKGKENDHVQAYAPTGAMVLKWRSSLTSELDGYPIASEPHLWWQACPWFSITIYCCPIKMSGSQFWVSSRKKAGKARWLSPWVCNFVLQTKKNTNSWAKVQLKKSTVGNNIVVFYCYLCHVK